MLNNEEYNEMMAQARARSIARVAAFEHKHETEGKAVDERIRKMMER
jgi:hypothetical protein